MRIVAIIISALIVCSSYGQADTITWRKLSSFPEPSFSASQMGCFLIDSDFFIVGGWIGSPGGIPENRVWKYNIPANHWTQLSNFPFGGVSSSCAFAINGKGYLLTARDSISNGDCDTAFWEYNSVNNSWLRKANFPDAPRQQSSSFVYSGKGYVGQTAGCSLVDSHFWQYDPFTNEWSQVATLPSPAIAASLTVASPLGTYLFDGEDRGGNFLKDIWRYDVIANHWDSIGQMPGDGRFFGVFWGLGNTIIGGGGANGVVVYNDFYRYDIQHNLWTPVVFQNFSDSAYYGATFVLGKTAYYFGGPTDLLQSTHDIRMWSFDASKYIQDTLTSINESLPEVSFSVFPNPVRRGQSFSIFSSEGGDIFFYDGLGRLIDEQKIVRGTNRIKLSSENGIVFYRCIMQSGEMRIGKVVITE